MTTSLLLFTAQLESAVPAKPPIWMQYFPFLMIAVIFYFLLIRPQTQAKKTHDALVAAAKTGDDVVTSAGILGTITNVKDRTFVVKIADNVKIEVLKSHIASVQKSVAVS